MITFFVVLSILILAFSSAVSMYVTNYKLGLSNIIAKTAAFVLITLVNTVAAIFFCVIALWPA